MISRLAAFTLVATLAGGVSALAQTGKTPSVASMSHDQAAAEGNNNQAVVTTSANASTPAKGANSFSRDQARKRLEASGFTHVSDLRKDKDGIWRAKAEKSGSPMAAWVDYKGNTGN